MSGESGVVGTLRGRLLQERNVCVSVSHRSVSEPPAPLLRSAHGPIPNPAQGVLNCTSPGRSPSSLILRFMQLSSQACHLRGGCRQVCPPPGFRGPGGARCECAWTLTCPQGCPQVLSGCAKKPRLGKEGIDKQVTSQEPESSASGTLDC